MGAHREYVGGCPMPKPGMWRALLPVDQPTNGPIITQCDACGEMLSVPRSATLVEGEPKQATEDLF